MTFTSLVTHFIVLMVGGASGWWLHYKFGAKLATLEAALKK